VREVKEHDGARLLTSFRRDVVHQSLVAGWDIAALAMQSAEGLDASTLVTGQPAALAARVAGAAGARFDACLRIERLDGLVVLEDRASALTVGSDGVRELRVDFGALSLNYGLYRALFDLSIGGQALARRSTLFEVFNPRPPRGGRPVLVYPTSVRVTALAP
jgi:lipopolysaccharide transport system ATP-binding protein